MNPYRLSVYFRLQVMLGLKYEVGLKFLIVEIPFLSIYTSFSKEAKGVRLPWIK